MEGWKDPKLVLGINTCMQITKVNTFAREIPWVKNPSIGWWLDEQNVTFYHGTHSRNLEGILATGIYAPKSGPTAGMVSLALEPNTAFGYASMSGTGGESSFRAAGNSVSTTPPSDRVVFKLIIPQSYFLSRMAQQRGHVQEYVNRLKDRSLYFEAKTKHKQDQEYYAITEIRLPKFVPAKYIKGYMFKVK